MSDTEKLKEFTRDELEKFFIFLDELRESGRTNMFAAGSYLQREFSMSPDASGVVLVAWQRSFELTPAPVFDRVAAAIEAANDE